MFTNVGIAGSLVELAANVLGRKIHVYYVFKEDSVQVFEPMDGAPPGSTKPLYLLYFR